MGENLTTNSHTKNCMILLKYIETNMLIKYYNVDIYIGEDPNFEYGN